MHTYTGELGSEVACLIRRLRDVANKRPEDVICIGTSATVTDNPEADNPIDGEAATRAFAHRLFGVPEERIEFITESYAQNASPADLYTPLPPADPYGLFDRILEAAADVHRQDEPGDLPPALLTLAEELCGRQAPDGATVNDRLYRLLAGNRLARRLEALLARPKLLEDVLPALRQLDGRQHADDDRLVAEMMAILTLGAIANQDGEPLLRPKLHYLIQGFQGLFISFEEDGLQLHFDLDGGVSETGNLLLPLYLCRSCGQHYSELIAGPIQAAQVGSRNAGYRLTRCVHGFEEAATDEKLFTITDRLHTQEDDEEPSDSLHLCRVCGTLHTESVENCLNPQCQSDASPAAVQAWEGEPSRCLPAVL